MALARLLAAKADGELLGATEFQVRERVLRPGARALEAALEGRKKGHRAVLQRLPQHLQTSAVGLGQFVEKKMPWWASEISPGAGGLPPPTMPASLMVWCGGRKGRIDSSGSSERSRPMAL